MQASELFDYIREPQKLDKESVGKLQQLVKDFPYFQSAHILLTLASKKWDAAAYQQTLKRTAIVAGNRAHLFRLINQLENAQYSQQFPKASPAPTELIKDKKETVLLQEVEAAGEIVNAEVPVIQEIPVETKAQDSHEMLEAEIAKEVVHSYVEKEILKTPELHKGKGPEPGARSEPVNFYDWLSWVERSEKSASQPDNETKLPDEERESRVGEPSGRKKKQAIIDRIIENNPGLIRSKEGQKFFTPENKARESLDDNEHLVTETLARIYALQGSTAKAIRAYEILSLKNPQKSAYFAALIKELKEKPKNNT